MHIGVRREVRGRRVRFCMITTFYPPYNVGGDGAYIYRLTNELARRGHEVEVVHCADAYALLDPAGPQGDFPNHPNVTVHTLRSGAGALSPLATQQTGLPAFKGHALRRIVERGDFDVLHFHNMSLIGPGALAYGGDRAIKLYTTHEHWLICPMHVLWKYGSRVCERPACFSCQLAGKRSTAARSPRWCRRSATRSSGSSSSSPSPCAPR